MRTLKTRISIPAVAEMGELIEVKTLISHAMESGFRRDARGEVIPRNILTLFECTYNDRLVMQAKLHPGIAANPFLSFFVRIDSSGQFEFRWTDQQGQVTRQTRSLTVDG